MNLIASGSSGIMISCPLKPLGIFCMILLCLSSFTAVVSAASYVDLERTLIGEQMGAWLPGWDYRRLMIINSSKVSETLMDFPVLVYLSESSGESGTDVTSIFEEIGNNYLKIAVTKDDCQTQLYVEIEYWNLTEEKAWLWVKVPSVSPSVNTYIYIYYDNAQPNNSEYVGDILSTPAQNVWDDNFLAVWHMRDLTNITVADSTGNEQTQTKGKGADQPIEADDLIGKCQDFNVSNAEYMRKTNTGWGSVSSGTVEVWGNLETEQTSPALYCYWSSWGWLFYLRRYASNDKLRFSMTVDSVIVIDIYSDDTVATGEDFSCAITQDSVTCKMFVDGAQQSGSDSGEWMDDIGGDPLFEFGWIYTYTPWDGLLDEIRVSNIDRGSSWVIASHYSEADSLIKYNSEVTGGTYAADVVIRRLVENYSVKLYDHLDNFICNATADAQGVANLTLTDYYREGGFEGTFQIYDETGAFIFSKWYEVIYGGDQYAAKTYFSTMAAAVVFLFILIPVLLAILLILIRRR